jgi:hypothetical protein
MNNFPDLPEENQHVFVTIACQCGVQGLQSNCCQGDRAHLDVSGLYQTDGYPSEMSMQLKEYVYDICSTTRSIIGENVLKPSGEGAGGIGAGGDSELEDEGGMKPENEGVGNDNNEGSGGDGLDTSWISDALDNGKDIVDTNGENGDATGGESGNGDANCHLYTKKQGCNKGAAECVWDAQLMKCIDITATDNATPEVEESRAPTTDEPSGLSAGAIAGIAIAGVVGLILAILAIRYFLRDDKVDNDEDDNKKSPLGGSNSAPPPNLEDLRTMNSLDGENPQGDNDQIYDATLGGSKTRPPGGWASKQRVQV